MTLFHAIRRRYQIHRAVSELSRLDNNILRDIGIERANIHNIVENMIDSRAANSTGAKLAGTGYATANFNAVSGAAA